MIDKIDAIWYGILAALTWIASLIAPGSEKLLLGMTLFLLLHFATATLVGIKEKRLKREMEKFNWTLVVGFYIAVGMTTLISEFYGGGDPTLARLTMSIVISYQAVATSSNLKTLGVPIPEKVMNIIDGINPDKKKNNDQEQ